MNFQTPAHGSRSSTMHIQVGRTSTTSSKATTDATKYECFHSWQKKAQKILMIVFTSKTWIVTVPLFCDVENPRKYVACRAGTFGTVLQTATTSAAWLNWYY